MRLHRSLLLAVLVAALVPAAAVAAPAPGGPGAEARWTEADKDGYGASTTTASTVWHTLDDGVLTEVYFPDLGTPAIRDLQLVVTDGRTFADRERDHATQSTRLLDARSLTYRQVTTDRDGRWQLTKTYATDPARDTLLIRVRLDSLTGDPYRVYALLDPALSNDGADDAARTQGRALVASDASAASALVGSSALRATSNGYVGSNDGWTDLRDDFRLSFAYTSAGPGNVAQTARLDLDGVRRRALTLALGFGTGAEEALAAARGSLARGYASVAADYARGWHAYLAGLDPAPKAASGHRDLYWVSAMTLAAHEDKTHRGAYIASPSMPWVWGQGLERPSAAYHLVWSRDLYQIATALLAAGDRAGAERALDYLFDVQQRPDGSFPQNSLLDGTPKWANLQLDEVALPIVLAWQLGHDDRWEDVKLSADFLVANGPVTPQERWENQGGYSPATIAAEIAGLVGAGAIARANGDRESAARYEQTADAWQAAVEGWTATRTGPYSDEPYYLRVTKTGEPDSGTTYALGDGGPSAIDEREVVDPSFLELVRLGVKAWDDPVIQSTLPVVDQRLAVTTPNGVFWHRYDFDGYGEKRDGSPWEPTPADTFTTIGRAWPLFAGERGEYELLAGGDASAQLDAIAASANEGLMLPEQVWDDHPPSGARGFQTGEGTFSATPLAWTHAQFIRLARSIDAGKPVERPAVVACRYLGEDC